MLWIWRNEIKLGLEDWKMFGFGGMEIIWIWRIGKCLDLEEWKMFGFGGLENVLDL